MYYKFCHPVGTLGNVIQFQSPSRGHINPYILTLTLPQDIWLKAISHHIFKAFPYGEEHWMYLCNISAFMSREKKNRKNIIDSLVKIWLGGSKRSDLTTRKEDFLNIQCLITLKHPQIIFTHFYALAHWGKWSIAPWANWNFILKWIFFITFSGRAKLDCPHGED